MRYCVSLLSMMEGEIVRAGEAGTFGLRGVQPVCAFAAHIPEMSKLLGSNVISFITHYIVQVPLI